ncbi:riboflavin synthase [Geoalkalibacter sp.]|uniref:riboflavin synthase n=1 Tax=Geoalkalibacter sp. TaxID=3041440 RepID=UPI00272EA9A0|nr:riboflavin synthase [Geoalkalibacter sp.]
MFTGLIEGLGILRDLRRGGDSCCLTLDAGGSLGDFVLGESIAVNGVCLTVTSFGKNFFQADVSPSTLESTTLGRLAPGSAVNLERALRLGDRLGGHLVTGHVDGVGVIIERRRSGNAELFSIRPPAPLMRYLVAKGSVAVDGISLTVNSVAAYSFSLTIIPHSLGRTNLQFLKVGDQVNLETDILGKYVERLLASARPDAGGGAVDLEFLAKNGYL